MDLGAFVKSIVLRIFFPQNSIIKTMKDGMVVAEYIEDGQKVRALQTSSGNTQGHIIIDRPDEVAVEYLRFIADGDYYKNVRSALLLGGGVYILPRWFTKAHPEIHVDVVEIDPAVTQTARDYFSLKDSPSLRIFHQDAYHFINQLHTEGNSQYDYIFQDAFGSSANIPPRLTTVAFFTKLCALLSPTGVFLINFLGSRASASFENLHKAIAAAFPIINVHLVNYPSNTRAFQNIILAAYKNNPTHIE